MGFNLKKLLRNDTVKVGLAGGAGYLLGKYAPQIKDKITDVRKIVQAKRNSLFPNYGKNATDKEASAPQQQAAYDGGGGVYGPQLPASPAGRGGGGIIDMILEFLGLGKGGR